MRLSIADSNMDRSKRLLFSFTRKSIDSNDIFLKRETPLSALTMTRVSTSSSPRQTAVLPSRKRKAFAANRPLKRCCHFVAKQDPIGTMQDDGIRSEKIFEQLNVLKRGGYWKHLLMGDLQDGFDGQDEESFEFGGTANNFRRKENKENIPYARHPNARPRYSRHGTTSNEEDEDYIEEEESRHSSLGQFIGSVIASNSKNETIGVSFRVHAITEEGWMCFLERKEQSMFLLRLPAKVAALGKEGMLVTGVDLMKRRDNGVLEPCTHFRPSNPSIDVTNALLVGSISYA